MPHFVLAWLGVLLQERFGRHDEAGRADAALQSRLFEKLLLQGMQPLRRRHALDRRHRPALHLDGEHQARIDEPAVEHHVAGAAVAVVATLFGAGEAQLVAQDVQETLPRLAEEIRRLAVDGGLNVLLVSHGIKLQYSSTKSQQTVFVMWSLLFDTSSLLPDGGDKFRIHQV